MPRYLLLICCLTLLAGCGRPRPPGPPVPKTTEITASESTDGDKSAELKFEESDWPMWRGANADGIAAGPAVPTTWSESENVVWKSKIPGRGHSSPIIIKDRIFLETADEQQKTQSVICLDRNTGEQLWQKTLFTDNFEKEMHRENTQASSTLACDGKLVFALFLNDRKIWATALDLDGKQVWQKEVGSFAAKFGYSASPVLYKSLVLLAADHQQGGFIAALNRADGAIVWRKARPEKSSYATPRVVTLDGKDQLVICGCRQVSSYDPLTGNHLWSTEGTADSGVGSPVVAGNLVIASAGWPERETMALKPDGSVAWRIKSHSYVPSLIAIDDHIYLVNEGIARCIHATTGKEAWQKRLGGGEFRSSPIASGGNIIVTNMSGKTTVFRANPSEFEVVAENSLGTEGFASPAVSQGDLYLRVADAANGPRQEWLYRIGRR
ncbi:MAG: PQQ-binding-like beta-propeller repeat protein [Planctomycetaceae bacterium]